MLDLQRRKLPAIFSQMDFAMRFMVLVVALAMAGAAPSAAAPATPLTPARIAQIKAKFLNDCFAQLQR